MADEGSEPAGLYMSLDDLIEENKDKQPRVSRGGGRGSGQQQRFDGGASRRQQYYAQRGRGRGEGQYSDRAAPLVAAGDRPNITCYNCGQPGHMARECPNQGGGGGGGGPAPIGPCFACGEMGHIQRDCPLANGGPGAGMPPAMGTMGPPLGMPMGGMGMGPGIPGMGMGPGMGLEGLRMQKMLLMQQQQELAMMEQQLALQQRQQEMMPGQLGRGAGGPRRQQQAPQQRGEAGQPLPDAYRKNQSCFLEEPSGDVVFRYKQTDIVRVAPNGDITLNTDGWYTPTTLASMNDALNCVGIRITAPGGNIKTGEWSITDGRALTRFFDGVVLPSKGPQHATRGRTLLQAFQNPNRSAAAMATAASNAAAAQAGIIPSMGYQTPSGAPGLGRGHGRGGGVFNRLGGKAENGSTRGRGKQQPGFGRMQMDDEVDGGQVRRLKAQGRYNPY